ncbi:MAG: metalloregulator ArsR/SmtB family transcription factor [Candidatus Pacebacteria bacterium]|nr:metalloregulator ArsR/SmtB family transcription factor [Candidatus Paceibacterota bacterium]
MAGNKASISEKDFERIMKAFANRRRLAILRFLKTEKEASVGDIAEEIKLSFKATSKHLGVLSAAGIVDREQRSLQMFYRISSDYPPPVHAVISIL